MRVFCATHELQIHTCKPQIKHLIKTHINMYEIQRVMKRTVFEPYNGRTEVFFHY